MKEFFKLIFQKIQYFWRIIVIELKERVGRYMETQEKVSEVKIELMARGVPDLWVNGEEEEIKKLVNSGGDVISVANEMFNRWWIGNKLDALKKIVEEIFGVGGLTAERISDLNEFIKKGYTVNEIKDYFEKERQLISYGNTDSRKQVVKSKM